MAQETIENLIQYHDTRTTDGQLIRVEVIGDNPTSVFIANLHGHEYKVGARLRSAMNRLLLSDPSCLGDHVRIFNAHPEAVKARTRLGLHNTDANRSFPHPFLHPGRESTAPIVETLMGELKRYPNIRLLCSFHGNVEEPKKPSQAFHLYDCTPSDQNANQSIFSTYQQVLIKEIESREEFRGPYKSAIHDGLDDPDLGNIISHGYVRQIAETDNDGSLEIWASALALRRNGASPTFPYLDRALVLEIPDKLDFPVQQRQIQTVFEKLIIPYLSYLRSQR